jgi:acylphosphatase
VGFRYTVRHLAARFAVTGFVRNLPDGRVHLLVEGPLDEVNGLLDAIRAAFGISIHREELSDRPITGRFNGFEIRF